MDNFWEKLIGRSNRKFQSLNELSVVILTPFDSGTYSFQVSNSA